jgi:hypothetical protein
MGNLGFVAAFVFIAVVVVKGPAGVRARRRLSPGVYGGVPRERQSKERCRLEDHY